VPVVKQGCGQPGAEDENGAGADVAAVAAAVDAEVVMVRNAVLEQDGAVVVYQEDDNLHEEGSSPPPSLIVRCFSRYNLLLETRGKHHRKKILKAR